MRAGIESAWQGTLARAQRAGLKDHTKIDTLSDADLMKAINSLNERIAQHEKLGEQADGPGDGETPTLI